MDEERIRDRIKKLRQTTGLTQKQFADRIGVRSSTIANYESGRNDPVDSVLALICREFHVSETWLRTGEGNMLLQEFSGPLEKFAEQHNLSEMECRLIEAFVTSPAADRQAATNLLQKLLAAVKE